MGMMLLENHLMDLFLYVLIVIMHYFIAEIEILTILTTVRRREINPLKERLQTRREIFHTKVLLWNSLPSIREGPYCI